MYDHYMIWENGSRLASSQAGKSEKLPRWYTEIEDEIRPRPHDHKVCRENKSAAESAAGGLATAKNPADLHAEDNARSTGLVPVSKASHEAVMPQYIFAL